MNAVFLTLSTNGDQLDTLAGDEVEGLVDVGDLVEAHLAAVGLLQGLARDDLEQQHELEAVAEVILDGLDAGARFAEMRVAPGGEGLQKTKGDSSETVCERAGMHMRLFKVQV